MKSKVRKIVMDSYGSFLGRDKGCFLLRDKNGREVRYPLFEDEIGEVQVRSGNTISSGVLASLSFWEIPLVVCTERGRPVGVLRSLTDNSHVKSRLAQYEATRNGKGQAIAKAIVTAKISGQNQVLRKYGLRQLDPAYLQRIKEVEASPDALFRQRLTQIEARCSLRYFNQIFSLFPIRPSCRSGYKSYDAVNNLFNLSYEYLAWKVHIALLRSRLEPFLGFLHSEAWSKPSLICDVMELYRFLIDDAVIGFAPRVIPKNIVLKTESFSKNRKGKREYINNALTREFTKRIEALFLSKVQVPRIRMGRQQELETLINEECLLLAQYLRNEKPTWNPRIVELR